jgi:hypothetical protein
VGVLCPRPPRPLPGARLSFLRRSRFTELVRRQLDLFAEDEAELLAEADEAERAYDAAERDAAEEAYGDFQLVLDAAADQLIERRETYAATLDEEAALEYAAAFERAVAKRFPRLRSRL